MNLFRSEEHIRNWSRFDPAAEQGIVSLADLVRLFSGNFFTKRLEPGYVTRRAEYVGDFLSAVAEIGKTKPFWRV